MTATEQNTIARIAIKTTLKRVQKNPDLRKIVGPGSETFDQLCSAFSALTGQDLNEVRDNIAGGDVSDIPHTTPQDMLDPDFHY
jgi:hypothetical protein